jgi:hypothetical protein
LQVIHLDPRQSIPRSFNREHGNGFPNFRPGTKEEIVETKRRNQESSPKSPPAPTAGSSTTQVPDAKPRSLREPRSDSKQQLVQKRDHRPFHYHPPIAKPMTLPCKR